MPATSFISGSSIPSMAGPGVPTRMPEGLAGGDGSNGMAFLFRVMPMPSLAASASAPPIDSGRRSARTRWESVPPDTIRIPSSAMPSANARAERTVRAA
jgi:hypothetical protein